MTELDQLPSSGTSTSTEILIEVPTDWLQNPKLGSSVRLVFSNFCVASLELGYLTELSGASYWDDPAPRLPKANQVCFSFHSFGEEPRVWRLKESYLPGYFTLDRLGYSGFSELARYPETFKDAIAGFDVALAEQTVLQLRKKLIVGNVSKYDQPAAREQGLPSGYIFLPLQTIDDIVVRCSRIAQMDAVEALAGHAARYGVRLVVKRHPLCRHDGTGALLDRLADEGSVHLSDASVHQLISGARAVVGANSGVLFEALLHGKPVYSYAGSDFEAATQRINDIDGLEEVFLPYVGPSVAEVLRFLGWYLIAYCVEADDLTKIRNRISQIVSAEMGGNSSPARPIRELLKRAFSAAEASRRQTALARTAVQQRIAIDAHDAAASALLDLWRAQSTTSAGVSAVKRRLLGRSSPPLPSLPPDVRAAPDASYYVELHSTLEAYKRNNWLVSYLPTIATQKAQSVTEVGCGNGQFLRLASEVFDQVVGADWVQTETLPLEKKNVRFVRTNLLENPVPPADLVCSADVLEHIPGSAIDSVISKLTRAGRLQFHVIACYDDGHSHLAVYSPATWLALFRRHLPEAYIFDIKPRFDDPNRLICVISNFPPEDQNNFDTPPQRPGRTSGVRRTAVEALLDRGEPIRLDVGSASTRPEGFLTVDVRPESGADIVADVRALPAEFGGRVSEIRARHVLEHLSRSDARAALRHWHDILVPGGRLNVIVPDIAFHARQFLGTAESTFESQFEHAMAGFYGWSDPERGGHDWDMHRWGYSEENLRTELLSAGFDWVERALDGSDPEPWHLNLWAHKPMADGEVGT